MGSISEWLLTHNSLVIMPKFPWFYVQSFEAQTRVWFLFGTQTWAETLFALILNVLFVWWKSLSSPSPDISSSLFAPLLEAQMRTARNEDQMPISVSERHPGELNLRFVSNIRWCSAGREFNRSCSEDAWWWAEGLGPPENKEKK